MNREIGRMLFLSEETVKSTCGTCWQSFRPVPEPTQSPSGSGVVSSTSCRRLHWTCKSARGRADEMALSPRRFLSGLRRGLPTLALGLSTALQISPNRGTPAGGGARKLRMTYQAVAPQAVAPPVAAARNRASTSLLMKPLLSRGTNGKTGYTPFEGRTQALRVSRSLLCRAVCEPVSRLGRVTCVVPPSWRLRLVLTGWTLGSPWCRLRTCCRRGDRRTRSRSAYALSRGVDFAAADPVRGGRVRPLAGMVGGGGIHVGRVWIALHEVGDLHLHACADRGGDRARGACGGTVYSSTTSPLW